MAARERLYVKAYTYRAPLFMVMPEESARRRDPCVSGFCRKICVMDVVFERFKRMYIYGTVLVRVLQSTRGNV